MKKARLIVVTIIILLLSLPIYVMSTFIFKNPIPDDEFSANLTSIVDNLETKIEGKGEHTLVFIHGYPDSLEMWDKQADFFKENYQVVRFTLPGFEQTDRELRPHYSIKQMRSIIDKFIEHLDQQSITVIAHDWGAVYASHYLKQNDLVDRLILLDIGSFADEPRPKINVQYTLALAVAWTLPDYLGTKLALFTADKILQVPRVDPHKSIEDLRPDSRLTYPYWHLWKEVLTSNTTQPVIVDDYGTPFLFIYGKDKSIWFHAKTWEQEVIDKNKGQIEVVPGGHWFMHSYPELVNQKIYNWLNTR
ncbi:alpha/beta hydrolase [Vibrio metschnikovii]|uniref:Alpha/beta hydrolase n=1 Tax=bacterium 19MO03SA05 TaxID=2920620 RepID=A0AAU6VFJ6_UNCXX|nr:MULTISPECIES: alpha/beta hydrolase [Vibrio]EKO3671499.1 alpha/beta hydrolase [Vibrio metschnikovii]EKO3708194.1 alpha/beta hydrolase [Vibrio metschnikovii]EKO3919931.1 alpha/beta hydrolase [Vibrio metschnikovii]MDQ2107893.1 alpha/beta hydrolase [Vibrio sp. 2017_1457_15]MDQ2160574.1 alpha/beta hydrolase [Vibrio sp. 2017_1457_13]